MADKKYGGKDLISDIVRGLSAGLGKPNVPMFQALPAGMPEAAGTSPEIFQAMMAEGRKSRAAENQMGLMEERYRMMGEMQRERLAQQAKLQEEAIAARAEAAASKAKDPRQAFLMEMLKGSMNIPGFNFGGLPPQKWLDRMSETWDIMQESSIGRPGVQKPKKGEKAAGIVKAGTILIDSAGKEVKLNSDTPMKEVTDNGYRVK